MGLGRGGSFGSVRGGAWLEGLRSSLTKAGSDWKDRAWRGEPHQVVVGRVGVVLWEGDVDPQGHAVGKDGQQDEDVEGPQVDIVKDPGRAASEPSHSFADLSTQCSLLTPR